MKLPRFYASLEATPDGIIQAVIRGGEYHHLRHVLRLKVGDCIEAVVEATTQQSEKPGSSFRCELVSILDTEAQAQILSEIPQVMLPALSLVVGLVKPSRCDWIVEKAIELGVQKIIFFSGERTQGQRGEEGGKNRSDRFMRVASAATKQAGPTTSPSPSITVSSSLKNALDELGHETKICKILLSPENTLNKTSGNTKDLVSIPSEQLEPGEPSSVPSLKLILENTQKNADFSLLIGPEGGFSADELMLASRHGYLEATLGPRVLRTETAAVVALGFVLHYELARQLTLQPTR